MALIGLLYTQHQNAGDKTVKNGYRYVLKDLFGRFLLQVKYYKPWASDAAIKKAAKLLRGISLSDVILHDCYIKGKKKASGEIKKLFVDRNRRTEFHLEHDPPTLYVVDAILDGDGKPESITKALKKYRLCFITGEEDDVLNQKGCHSTVPPCGDRYKYCGINANKLPKGDLP